MTEERISRGARVSRRTLLSASMLTSLAMLLPGCSRGTGGATASEGFTRTIANLVIPATETAGAGEPPTVAYIERALAHGAFRGDNQTLGRLEQDLNDRAGGISFMKLSPDRQMRVLAELDGETFGETPGTRTDNERWRHVKDAIVTGYYTGETGASKELVYDFVPGRWEPDIPLDPTQRYWSNNWMANLG